MFVDVAAAVTLPAPVIYLKMDGNLTNSGSGGSAYNGAIDRSGALNDWGTPVYSTAKNGQGICLNPNMVDFKVPSILDIPLVEPVFVEPEDPFGPFGAKGVGEPPYSLPAPAIANAIYNAVGVRFNEIPINIQSILEELNKVQG